MAGAAGDSGDVMLSPEAVMSAAQKLLSELLAFRDTVDRLYRQPPPGPADYGNLNADKTVAEASGRFSVESATRGRAELDKLADDLRKVIEYAAAMRNNEQATAARLAAIARGSHGG